ncbi:hypothetical protein [uncultured Jatrophihabitans sp.]|uniref:hypothetical protein n=1 Tax=uncultured Jatrophihabitans sp. TaxID=1610747 RepID=UPI0035CC0CF8
MKRHRAIVIRGAQRPEIDAAMLAQILLALAAEWDKPAEAPSSPDAFDAAIEDRAE